MALEGDHNPLKDSTETQKEEKPIRQPENTLKPLEASPVWLLVLLAGKTPLRTTLGFRM
jgi:hypothetical protein